MAAAEADGASNTFDITGAPEKRFKTSDLPLNAAQRSSIDGLLHAIKKKGEFDKVRKQVWSRFSEHDAKTKLAVALADLVEFETDREPSLLSRDRGKAATLTEGAVDRSNIYKSVEATLDLLIAEHLENVESVAREVRRIEVGKELAIEEETRGNRSDEKYDEEVAAKRSVREKLRKQEEAKKKREEEKEKLRQEEKQKLAELERLRRLAEKRKEDEVKAERRRQEREARREAEKRLQAERDTEKKELYEKRKLEEQERAKEREMEREKGKEKVKDRDRWRSRSRDYVRYRRDHGEPARNGDYIRSRHSRSRSCTGQVTPEAAPTKDLTDAEIEEAALELLLKEGRELAAKSQPQTELERSESLEPPPRRGQLAKTKSVECASKVKEVTASDIKTSKATGSTGESASRRNDKAHVYSEDDRRRDDSTREDHRKDDHRQEGRREDDYRRDESKRDDPRRENRRRDDSRRNDYGSRRDNRSRGMSRERLSYSQTGRYRSRSRSPPSGDQPARWDSERRVLNPEEKEAWKRDAVRKRELEAEAYKRAVRESQTKPRERSRSRDHDIYEGDRGRRDSELHRPSGSRNVRSRSRSPQRRTRTERSRSPRPRKGYRDEPTRSLRPKSPLEIDRYVPGGSSRARSRDREGVPPSRHERDDRDRRNRDREQYSERDRGRDRGREKDEKYHSPDIDRYVPRAGAGTSIEEGKKKAQRDRSRSR